MNENVPTSCFRSTGPGEREEAECMVCTDRIGPTTETITHLECRAAICADCFFAWTRAKEGDATCPNCRGLLQGPAAQDEDPWVYYVPEMGEYLDHEQAVEETTFYMKVEAALVRQTGIDVEIVLHRLGRQQGREWLALRPNMIQEIQAQFEQRRRVRRRRAEDALRDDEDESEVNALGLTRRSRRESRQERWARHDRERNRAARLSMQQLERDAVVRSLTDGEWTT